MWKKRFTAPALVAILSLGFMSHNPFEGKSVRRIAGTECVNCNERQLPSVTAGLPPHLAQYLVATGLASSTDQFQLFSRQLEIQSQLSALNPLLVGGSPLFYRPLGLTLPTYPSYALPTLEATQVSLVKPDSSNQIFGGLSSDPALKYLVTPLASRQEAPPATVASAIETVKPLPGAAAEVRKEADGTITVLDASESVVPKTQDRLAQANQIHSSPLLGSRPVKQTAAPSVTFTGRK